MNRILLICAAGMSTSMLVKRMEAAAKRIDVKVEISAFGVDQVNEKLSDYDVVLLGPQIRYKQAEVTRLAAEQGKNAAVINSMDYGMMNGEKILKAALELIS